MRVIIRCAGEGSRWNNFKGVPKHLAPLCGETVLGRAVRLVDEFAPDADVRIVVTDTSDDRYKIPGATRATDKANPDNGDVDKMISAASLWSKDDRTVTLFGDVWWHRDTLRDVLTSDLGDDGFRWWGRFGPGDPPAGGELFAMAHLPDASEAILAAAEEVAELHRSGGLEGKGYNGGSVRGGWALYRTLCGVDVGDHADHGHLTVVDEEWTQDMDTSTDWDRWCYEWATRPDERPEV